MHKVVVGITGASGSIYARLLIEKLLAIKDQWQELAVVITENAKEVWKTELGNDSYGSYPVKYYGTKDFLAPFASGSGRFNTLFLVPCSMGTLGRIANGISDDLITRAADVMLKEKRKLICVLRETPYNLVHVKNMETIILAGGVICPANPSFYSRPKSIDEVASTVVDRVIDIAGFDLKSFRWGG